MRNEESIIEGRNAVLEAIRSGKTIDKIFVLENSVDGPTRTILREADKNKIQVNRVSKERLDQITTTGKHQGVIAYAAAFDYSTVDDILAKAKEKAFIRWQTAMVYKLIKVSNYTFGEGYDKAITKLIDEGEIELDIDETADDSDE